MGKISCALLLWSLMTLLSACADFGPGRVPGAQLGYNHAVSQSSDEQMLLNLVRLRYRHVPVFLALSSVLTQYTYAGQLGVRGDSGSSLGKSMWSVGGAAEVLYGERPTLTFTPITGDEYAQQLIRPIPPHRLFSLVQSGWPPEILLGMGLVQINHLENLPFNRPPSAEELQQLRVFRRVVELILELDRRHAIEMQRDEKVDPPERYILLAQDADPETQVFIDEFRQTLRLDPQVFRFRVTRQLTGRKPDEITLRLRSMLALMGYVARGVDIPEPHLKEGRAPEPVSGQGADSFPLVPFRVYSLEEEPKDAFVAVRYEQHWFYLKHSDHRSKTAFGLLTYLFQLQAPVPQGAGPILTLPAGGGG